jgi:Rps23 Pro-64 3,4-dihydroxylase Tpa1-like proline 4-hydroxylase
MSSAIPVIEPPSGAPVLDRAGHLFRFNDYEPSQIGQFRTEFQHASPFPHLVIDEFLSLPAEQTVPHFPGDAWPHWNRFVDAYQFQKRSCREIDVLPRVFQQMVYELSSPAFLAFLEKITGISGLIPDPYLEGGGLHCSGPGGILAPHADFHSYGKLGLFRRINVLVYLNPGWKQEFGGCLEFFRKGEETPSTSIVPIYGRLAMFMTDDKSIHGFTHPVVGEDRWRKSLALYYYTAEDTEEFKGDGVTYWQTHGKQSGLAKAQILAYKALLHGSWTLSKAAHRMNPNFKRPKPPASKT